MPSECIGCDYSFSPNNWETYCQYILNTGHRRPCKAGKGCTVRKTAGVARVPFSLGKPPEKRERKPIIKKWYRIAAEMYADGKNDRQIGEALGLMPKTILEWRHRTNRPAVTGRGRQKGEDSTSEKVEN